MDPTPATEMDPYPVVRGAGASGEHQLDLGPVRHGRPREQGQTSPLREDRALQLRLSGATFGQIAEALGYAGRQGAQAAVMRGMERHSAASAGIREEYRALTLARTERLMMRLWPKALEGDLGAVDRVIKVMERQARLLGLDAPTQVTLTDDTRAELSAMIVDLEQMLIADQPDEHQPVPGEVVE